MNVVSVLQDKLRFLAYTKPESACKCKEEFKLPPIFLVLSVLKIYIYIGRIC